MVGTGVRTEAGGGDGGGDKAGALCEDRGQRTRVGTGNGGRDGVGDRAWEDRD